MAVTIHQTDHDNHILRYQYTASGFRTDLMNFLQQYLKSLERSVQTPFLHFTKIWHELDFYKIFYGRYLKHDCAEFTAELFRIVVNYVEEYMAQCKTTASLESLKNFSFFIFIMQGLYFAQRNTRRLRFRFGVSVFTNLQQYMLDIARHKANPINHQVYVFKRLTAARAFDFVQYKNWHLLGDDFGVPKVLIESHDMCSPALYEPNTTTTINEREQICVRATAITNFKTKYEEMRTKVVARGVFRDQRIRFANPCQEILDFYDQVKRNENIPNQLENEQTASQLRAQRVMEIKKRAAGRRVRHISMTENDETGSEVQKSRYHRGRPLAITREPHAHHTEDATIAAISPSSGKRKRIEIFQSDSENESHQVAENIQRDLARTMRQLEHMDAMEREEQENREEKIRKEQIQIQKEIEEESKRRTREEENRVKAEQKRISEKKKRDALDRRNKKRREDRAIEKVKRLRIRDLEKDFNQKHSKNSAKPKRLSRHPLSDNESMDSIYVAPFY